jgi:predicted MFS family arabinose efflux permease
VGKGRDNAAATLSAAFAGMFAMATVMGIGRFVYTPILPMMIADGSLDPRGAGLVAGANFLGYLLGALAASARTLRNHGRRIVLAGMVASISTTAAMALDPGLHGMLAIRFLSGVASAFAMIFITATVISHLSAGRRPGLIALHFGGVGLGIATSALLVTALAKSGAGWQAIWLAAALAGLFGLGAVLSLLPKAEGRSATPPDVRADRFGLPLMLLTASYCFFGFGYVVTATFINTMARGDPALAGAEPYVWAAVGLAGLPSLWLWNRLSDSTGPFVAYVGACLLEAFAVMLPVAAPSVTALMLSAILFGGTFMAITSLGFARARTMQGGSGSRALALMTAAFGVGQMVGPILAGILFDRSGSLNFPTLLAGGALVVAALLATCAEFADRVAHRR